MKLRVYLAKAVFETDFRGIGTPASRLVLDWRWTGKIDPFRHLTAMQVYAKEVSTMQSHRVGPN